LRFRMDLDRGLGRLPFPRLLRDTNASHLHLHGGCAVLIILPNKKGQHEAQEAKQTLHSIFPSYPLKGFSSPRCIPLQAYPPNVDPPPHPFKAYSFRPLINDPRVASYLLFKPLPLLLFIAWLVHTIFALINPRLAGDLLLLHLLLLLFFSLVRSLPFQPARVSSLSSLLCSLLLLFQTYYTSLSVVSNRTKMTVDHCLLLPSLDTIAGRL